MVFKFATFDPAQDPNDYNPAFPTSPPSSPSATLCRPCEYTCTLTRAIVSRLAAAGASLVFIAPTFEFEGREIRDESSERQFYSISSDVRPQFHQRQLKEFTLKELTAATENFSNRKILGRGGFSKVYEGQIADGSLVAIKRCREPTRGSEIQFQTEVELGSLQPQHLNLLPLLGFCMTSKCGELLLVYPLMIHGSVASCLRERHETKPPLDWPTRRKIATGAARGLSHLHDLNIVHRDIKAANIMLDEEFEPHIGDFGLAKFINPGGNFVDGIEEASALPRRESEDGSGSKYYTETTAVRGTIGHIGPEYLSTGKCSVKTDVFGFGVMLLELVTGQRAFDLARLANDHDMDLLDWLKGLVDKGSWEIVVDPDLQDERGQEEIEKVIQLALLCTQTDPRRRPSMAQVVQILEGHDMEERWEKYCHSKSNGHTDWIVADSTSNLLPEQLSGPR